MVRRVVTMTGKDRLMVCCAALLVLMMGSIGIRYVTSRVIVRGLGIELIVRRNGKERNVTDTILAGLPEHLRRAPIKTQNSQKTARVNKVRDELQKEYPFEDTDKKQTGIEKQTTKNTVIEKFQNKKRQLDAAYMERLQLWSNRYLTERLRFVYATRRMEDIIGWNVKHIGYSDVPAILENGYLIWNFPKFDQTALAASIERLSNVCQQQGCGFLLVQAPYKIAPDEPGIAGIVDFSNQNSDMRLELLRKRHVAVLDIREDIQAENLDYHSLFFRTDHHWKPETALWATKHIAERLNSDFGFQIDTSLFDIQNFQVDIYPSWFLGSQGKRATLARTKPEDFSLLYPKYDTDIQFTVPTLNIDKRGSFRITHNMWHLEKKDYYGRDPHTAYSYTNEAIKTIYNYTNASGKKILFLIDSYGRTVAPFLALSVQKTDILDLRFFPASLETYIKKTKPNIVIALYTSMGSDYGGLMNWDIPPQLR